MKISDFKKAQDIINKIQECSNRIEGIKKFLVGSQSCAQNCLYVDGEKGYFNGFYLTKSETENIMCRLENERTSLILTLKELGVEMS